MIKQEIMEVTIIIPEYIIAECGSYGYKNEDVQMIFKEFLSTLVDHPYNRRALDMEQPNFKIFEDWVNYSNKSEYPEFLDWLKSKTQKVY